MKILYKILFIILLSLFFGCAQKYYKAPQSALIVIKSPQLKYADMGFIYRGLKYIKVQIYEAGQVAFTMTVGKRICVDRYCMKEAEFYKKYMQTQYPSGTLQNIFLKKAIFGGENMQIERGEHIQHIYKSGKFDIIYTFDAESVKFKDKINHNFIKIMEQ